ncbi:MAG: hypothetical protein AB8B80_13870 [Marinicellaceae bacterium]
MTMTIKEIIDQALSEVGHPTEASYFGGTNDVITAIAQRSVSMLSQQPISTLKKQGTITMTSSLVYPLPSDYKYIISNSMNAVDNERMVQMPTSNSEWHYLKAQTGQNGITYKCRIFDGSFNFEYVESGQVIQYEYVSKYYVADSNVTDSTSINPTGTKERFTDDSDYCLIDDNLLILDIIWRYGKTKNVEGWQADKQILDDYFKNYLGDESGSQSLDMSGDGQDNIVSPHYPLWQV